MVCHNIGNMLPEEMDKHCESVIKTLVSVFGEGRVVFFPTRDGEAWDFTIIRKE